MFQDVNDHNFLKLTFTQLYYILDKEVVIVSKESSNFCLSSNEMIFCFTREFKNSTAMKPTRAKPAKGSVP